MYHMIHILDYFILLNKMRCWRVFVFVGLMSVLNPDGGEDIDLVTDELFQDVVRKGGAPLHCVSVYFLSPTCQYVPITWCRVLTAAC